MIQKHKTFTEQIPTEASQAEATLLTFLNSKQALGRHIIGVGIIIVDGTNWNYYEWRSHGDLAEKLAPIEILPVTPETAAGEISKRSHTHHFLSHCAFQFADGLRDILIFREGPQLKITGRMSTFGGPNDTGVGATEGLALLSNAEAGKPRYQQLFNPPWAAGKALARQLDAENAFYLALRWDYAVTPRAELVHDQCTFLVSNPANGLFSIAEAVDWGPHAKTGRVADLSDALARKLGLKTDEESIVEVFLRPGYKLPVPLPGGAPVSTPPPAGSFRQRLIHIASEQYKLYHSHDETESPLSGQIKSYWDDLATATGSGSFAFPGVAEAWSAVFISWCVLKAVPSYTFKYAAQHSEFVHAAIQNSPPGFVGRDVSTFAPRLGDILQNNRTSSKHTFAYASTHYAYKSHSAIVIGFEEAGGQKYAITIGGNEGDSVGRKRIRLNPNGTIIQPQPNHFISVIECPD